MLRDNRIIDDDNGTLVDFSVSLSNFYSNDITLNLVGAEDKLYIGSTLPFNHRYFYIPTGNIDDGQLATVEIWDGTSWNAAVDVIDETDDGNKSFAQSGIISWALARTESWGQEEETADIPELATLNIYDLYWARLTFSGDIQATVRYVGHKFSADEDFGAEYPDLANDANLKTAWESGKTSWEEQHIAAAELVVNELKKQKRLWTANQILRWEDFNLAAKYKAAELIYSGFGDDYEDQRRLAAKRFHDALSVPNLVIDRNEDGRVEEFEKRTWAGAYRS